MSDKILITYIIAAVVIGVIWIIIRLLTRGAITLRGLLRGKDGGLSTAQFQAFLWTLLIFAAYIVVYTANAINGNYSPLIQIPGNLLVISGLGAITYIGANKITQSQLSDKVGASAAELPKDTTQEGKLGDLVTGDDGKGDLGKLQLMMWTMLAAGLFIIQFHNRLVDTPLSLLQIPDIDPSLLALVGLGQGAYLAKKAVVDDPTPTPQAVAIASATLAAKAAQAAQATETARAAQAAAVTAAALAATEAITGPQSGTRT